MSSDQTSPLHTGTSLEFRSAELGDGWLEAEVAQAGRLLMALERELVEPRGEVAQHRGELSSIEQGLATVAGRTERHEEGQQLARNARHESAELRERLEGEAALRRELGERLARITDREISEEGAHQLAREALGARVSELEERAEATSERERRITAEVAAQDTSEIMDRIAVVEREIEVERDMTRRVIEGIARIDAVFSVLSSTVEELDVRARTLSADQRRLGDDMAALHSERDRESELLEVVEQQRAVRHRLGERVADLDERLVENGARLDAAEEDRALVRRELAGAAERVRALGEALEDQRLAVVEHQRRRTLADEDTARRHADELDREVRVSRELLVRLSEVSEQTAQDQPL